MRRIWLPTGRLAAVAAAGAVALLVLPPGWPSLAAVNALVLGAAALDGLLAVPVGQLTLHRDLPQVVGLEEQAEVRWQVASAARRGGAVAVADDLPPALGAQTRRARLTVPAGGTARAQATLRPQRRGRWVLEGATARSRGPLGLVVRQGRLPARSVLRVVPSFRSRQEAELRARRARLLEEGQRSVRERGAGTDFAQLREWTPDDEHRHIDWAATARANKLIVREHRVERNQHVVALLDTGRLMAGRIATAPRRADAAAVVGAAQPRLEHGMDAVLALATVAIRLGDRTGLVAYADRVRATVPATGGRPALGRLTDALYQLDAELVESDLTVALRATLQRFRRRALLVVCTELAPGSVAETLLPALPLAVRDHLVLVAAARDPALDALARATPADAVQAHRQAAAADALAARRRLAARLRAAGAGVVDEPPGRLAGAIADAYVARKQRGRL